MTLALEAWALPWNIISNPDPLPKGIVGENYEVVFKTDVGYKADWQCTPADPVPGLTFSAMSNVDSITLSGKPTRAGVYQFTLRVYYKNELRAERSFTIQVVSLQPPSFSIYAIQLKPSRVENNLIIVPGDVYRGQEILIVFYTDHPEDSSINWRGLQALPGTSFSVERKSDLLQRLPQNLQTAASIVLRNVGYSSPLLVLSGSPSAAGVFSVSVQARDKYGQERQKTLDIEVKEAICNFSLRVDPPTVIWNVTTLLFDPVDSRYTREEYKQLNLTITATCPGNPNQPFRGHVTVAGADGLNFSIPLPGGSRMPLSAYPFFLRLNSSGLGSISLPILVTMGARPLELASPYPGTNYTAMFSLTLEYFNQSYIVKDTRLSVAMFYYLPIFRPTSLKPITQFPNPSHIVGPGHSNHMIEDRVVIGKQATFELEYEIQFPVSGFVFMPVIKLVFPKSEWEWQPQRLCDAEACILPLSEHFPSLSTRFIRWYNETADSYELYILDSDIFSTSQGLETRRLIVLEEFKGEVGFWYPKPKAGASPSVTVSIVALQVRGEGLAWIISSGQRPPPFASSQRVFRFEPIAVREAGFRLGYIIAGREQLEQHGHNVNHFNSMFPLAIRKYMEGSFPVTVKEVRFLGFAPQQTSWYDLENLSISIAEQLPEAHLHKAVVIVYDIPGPSIGVVFLSARSVALVEFEYANHHTYLPVVAHELSHTFGYPDIYYGVNFPQDLCWTCTYFGIARDNTSRRSCSGIPQTTGKVAYFDEVNGGLIDLYLDRVNDIMACYSSSDQRAYHSWWEVYLRAVRLDPPKALLISFIIYKNGTVVGRPFSVVYNYTLPYIDENVTGDYLLQLVSKSGKVLKSYAFNASYEVYDAPIETNITSIISVVEWFDDLGEIRLLDSEGYVLFTRLVSPHTPEVEILYPLAGLKLQAGGSYVIHWKGKDEDNDHLWYNVQIRRVGEESWSILAHRLEFDQLRFQAPTDAGWYELMVKATDGVNTAYKIVRVEVVMELPTYHVVVTSNVGVAVEGSGLYAEGDNVTARAPSTSPVPGVWGMLGARYEFRRWQGVVNSSNNIVSFIAVGSGKELHITAIYEENLIPAYMAIAFLLLLFLSLAIIVIKYYLKNKNKK